MTEVLTCGEALVAGSPQRRGRLGEATPLGLHVAGAESNVAIGLARLGIAVRFAGAVGADPFGDMIQTRLAGEGVNVEGLQRRSDPTGIFFKEWYGLIPEPRVYYYRTQSAGSQWTATESDCQQVAQSKWFHTTGITAMLGPGPHEGITTLMAEANHHSVSVSMDVNLRLKLQALEQWCRILKPILSQVTVIFATAEELAHLYGEEPIADYFDRGLFHPAAHIVLKYGQQGSKVFDASGEVAAAAGFKVASPIDPVGAGDGFAAGVIAGRLKGLSWAEALRLGSLVGALAVNHPGDFEGYPRWDEAQALLTQSWVDR